MKKTLIYVGQTNGVREVFRTKIVPTFTSHGKYAGVIGPFRTMRGARWMAHPIRGVHNPHCVTVGDAERLGKAYRAYYNPATGWGDPRADDKAA